MGGGLVEIVIRLPGGKGGRGGGIRGEEWEETLIGSGAKPRNQEHGILQDPAP